MSSMRNSPTHLFEPPGDPPTSNNGESPSPKVETTVPPKDLHLIPQARSCARDQLSVHVHYEDPGGEITGHTKDLSPNGMGLVLSRFVKKGAPLSLQCSFGEICYLTISGQVRYCKEDPESHPGLFLIGVKFSALREWEQNILSSAIRELRENPETKARSFFKVTFAEDQLALEAARVVVHGRPQLPDIGHRSSKHCSKIVGWGSYLPDTEISNEEISARLLPLGYKNVGETIENLTGLKTRRFASSERYPSDLAVLAAQDALRHAKIHPKDLDVIIFFGISRDFHEPATANVVQDKLGASKAYVYDLANACNGFVTAVDALDSMIASGRCETGLVVTGELISPYIDWSPKTKKDFKLSMFGYTIGDAGGAAVLTKTARDEQCGIKGRWFWSVGKHWRLALAGELSTANEHNLYFKSQGRGLEDISIDIMPEGFRRILHITGWSLSDIDLVIPHQIPISILNHTYIQAVGIPKEKLLWTFPEFGNLATASMPVAMCQAIQQQRVKSGDKVILAGGAAGFSAGYVALVV